MGRKPQDHFNLLLQPFSKSASPSMLIYRYNIIIMNITIMWCTQIIIKINMSRAISPSLLLSHIDYEFHPQLHVCQGGSLSRATVAPGAGSCPKSGPLHTCISNNGSGIDTLKKWWNGPKSSVFFIGNTSFVFKQYQWSSAPGLDLDLCVIPNKAPLWVASLSLHTLPGEAAIPEPGAELSCWCLVMQ